MRVRRWMQSPGHALLLAGIVAALGAAASPKLGVAPGQPLARSAGYCASFEPALCREWLWPNGTGATAHSVVVVLPRGYDPRRRYHYLVVTDVHRNLALADAAVRSLEGVIEPLILIGIGTPRTADDAKISIRRILEFTDDRIPARPDLDATVEETCRKARSALGRCRGGAPGFYQAITDRLLPALAKRYALAPSGNALVGTSAGGYFVVLAALRYPGGFSNYIATSPAMGYGAALLDGEPDMAARGRRLYVAVGGLERQSPFLAGPADVTGGFARLQRFVATHRSTAPDASLEVIEGYGHGDVVVPALIKALRKYYGKPD